MRWQPASATRTRPGRRRTDSPRHPSQICSQHEWNEGIVDRDVLALIEVDVPDTAESRQWLRAYARDVLRERFRQKAVYLKFVGPVDQLIVSEEEVGDED